VHNRHGDIRLLKLFLYGGVIVMNDDDVGGVLPLLEVLLASSQLVVLRRRENMDYKVGMVAVTDTDSLVDDADSSR